MNSSLSQKKQDESAATRAHNRRLNCVSILSNYMHCINISKLASIQLQWENENRLDHLVVMQKCAHMHVVETLRQLYWWRRIDQDNGCKLALHMTNNDGVYDLKLFTLVFDLNRCKPVWPNDYEIARFGINSHLLPIIHVENLQDFTQSNRWNVLSIIRQENTIKITLESSLFTRKEPMVLNYCVMVST